MQMCFKVRMHIISRVKKQMTYGNGLVVRSLFPDMDSDLAGDWIHAHVFLFLLGAALRVPYPGATSSAGTAESSLGRPEESVSDALFYLVSNTENTAVEMKEL